MVDAEEIGEMAVADVDELPMILWDSMGWAEGAYKGGEINFMLDGNLPNRFPLNPEVGFESRGL